jgi:hypothetical protein
MAVVKRKTSSKHSVKFILAEDARGEGDGKFSLLGVFPDERVWVKGDVPPGLGTAAFALPSLACVFIITGPPGKYTGHFSVIGTDGKTKILDAAIDQSLEILKGRPATFVTAMKPFVGPAFGSYSMILELGKEKHKFPFVVEKAPPEAKRR